MSHRPPTRGHVEAALRAFRIACRPTERELAETRLLKAKEGMSAAARAIIANAPDAERLANDALEEFTTAQAAIRLLDETTEAP